MLAGVAHSINLQLEVSASREVDSTQKSGATASKEQPKDHLHFSVGQATTVARSIPSSAQLPYLMPRTPNTFVN
jgi:hypothetical protein